MLLKNGKRICGAGGALATAPLVQSKSYFEVKLQQNGYWAIGVATKQTNINSIKGGSDPYSWCLCSDNTVRHGDKEISRVENIDSTDNLASNFSDETKLIEDDSKENTADLKSIPNSPAEGDTIGVTYDHVELNFYLNGKNLEVPVLNVKGSVFPVLYGENIFY